MSADPDPEPGFVTPGPAQRRRFSWVWYLLPVLGIVILINCLLPPRGRNAASRSQCKNNLKQIGLALHNYLDAYSVLPPAYTVDDAGRPLHSWRTLLLPYIDQQTLYNTIDLSKPWDDPVNATACKTSVPAYRCPSADIPADHTTYLAIVAPGLPPRGQGRGREPGIRPARLPPAG